MCFLCFVDIVFMDLFYNVGFVVLVESCLWLKIKWWGM